MAEKDLVTVITPTFNRAHLIERAIKSVLNQSFTNWEYIIVDDASADNTKEVVGRFDDKRIRYLRYEKNGGNARARNVGVYAAKGEFIAFLDSDDEYCPEYLSKAYAKLIDNPQASFLWSGTRTLDIDGNSSQSIWVPKRKQNPNQFLYELHVGIGRGFLIKKDCFQNLNFDERLRTAVDTDFLIRLKQNFEYTILEEILVCINTQPGSVRSNYREKKKSYKIIIDKHHEILKKDKFLKFKWYYKLLWLALYDNDRELAHVAFSEIKSMGKKPQLLWIIFYLFPTSTAVKIHKILSH